MRILLSAALSAALLTVPAAGGAAASYEYKAIKLPDGVTTVQSESEGRIVFKNSDNKYGYMDENYNIIIPAKYDAAYSFENGLAYTRLFDYNAEIIDINGNALFSGICNSLIFSFDEYGIGVIIDWNNGDRLINTKGETSAAYDCIWDHEDGVVLAQTFDGDTVLVDKDFNEINLSKYGMVDHFISDERILVANGDKYGYIDTKGNEIIPLIYDYDSKHGTEYWFDNGLAAVSQGGRWGVINKKGEVIIPIEYDTVDVDSRKLIAVVKDGIVDLFDRNGNIVHKDVKSSYKPCLYDGEKGKWYIDRATGLKYKYELSSGFYEDGALAENNTGYGIVDRNYDIVHDFNIPVVAAQLYRGHGEVTAHITPSEMSEGLINVCAGGKWGYMNTRGEMVIEPQFDIYYKPYPNEPVSGADTIISGAMPFRHGYAKVSIGGVRHTVDKAGNIYDNVDIEGASGEYPYLYLDGGYAALRDENENTLLEINNGTLTDENGNVLVENCINTVYDSMEKREHPSIKMIDKSSVIVTADDGTYVIRLL